MHMDAHIKSAPNCAGFSLMELMLTLILLLFLLVVALPSFIPILNKTEVTAASLSLREGLSIARAEAVKRSASVQVCSLNLATMNCAGNRKTGRQPWAEGFMVFHDVDDDASFTDGLDSMLYVAHFPEQLRVDWARGDYIVYSSSGALKFGNGSFNISNSQSGQGLKLILNIVGRVRSVEL